MMALEHLPGGLTAGLVRIGELTNRSLVLPLVVFYPTARCNSRCLSCDWWRASGEDDLSVDEIRMLVEALPALGTRVVLFSGGEPLLRRDVFAVARLFRDAGLRLHLLTSGVLLERFAPEVAATFERVVVSLDATTESLYKGVRGVAALACVERGVARVRELAPTLPMTARSTLHRYNFRELPALIDHARAMGLDGISFLAADLGSTAFGRHQAVVIRDLALSAAEVTEFTDLVSQVVVHHADDFASGFVAETPDRLRRLPAYYAALAGLGPFPPVSCNAPWMSVVVEADGTVRPCFFHEPIGSIRTMPLGRIVAANLSAFRRALDVTTNGLCRRCVCSIRTGWWGGPWQ
jgi:MoaA/NifB/PqqE/SkfB family radical SAM enzyme